MASWLFMAVTIHKKWSASPFCQMKNQIAGDQICQQKKDHVIMKLYLVLIKDFWDSFCEVNQSGISKLSMQNSPPYWYTYTHTGTHTLSLLLKIKSEIYMLFTVMLKINK